MPWRQLSSVLPRMSTLLANTCSRVAVSRITDVEVEHQVADLLHPADQGELGIQPAWRCRPRSRCSSTGCRPRRSCSATGAVSTSSKRPDSSRRWRSSASIMRRRAWSRGVDALHLPLQAGVDQLEIENRDARRRRRARDSAPQAPHEERQPTGPTASSFDLPAVRAAETRVWYRLGVAAGDVRPRATTPREHPGK